jgi:hypothetical protein
LAGFPLVVPGLVEATTHEISADDRFIYISDRGGDQIFSFLRNTASGQLTLDDVVPSGGDAPTGIGLTPDGRLLYAAHGDGTLVGFSVGADGSLTPLAGGATVYATGPTVSYKLAFFNDIVYVGSGTGSTLNAFRINATGALTQLAGFPRNDGGPGPTIYPFVFEELLYVSDAPNNQVRGFVINDSGSLTPAPGSPYPANGSPTELTPAIVSF